MPDFGLETARKRILDAMHGGNWERVDAELTAYAAAVWADARFRALAEAVAAIDDLAQADTGKSARDFTDAVKRLQ